MDYFTIEAAPGKRFFRCEAMRASLSIEACASMWRKTNHGDGGSPFPARPACRRCPLGAQHAGEAQASMSPVFGSGICARCHNGGLRLIGGMICVSCKNREYELARGANYRGKPPRRLAGMPSRLARRAIRFMVGGHARDLEAQRTLDADELVVAALRDSRDRVRFGFHVEPRMRQLRLF